MYIFGASLTLDLIYALWGREARETAEDVDWAFSAAGMGPGQVVPFRDQRKMFLKVCFSRVKFGSVCPCPSVCPLAASPIYVNTELYLPAMARVCKL